MKKRLRLQASLRIGISVMAIMMSAAAVLPSQTHAEIVYTKSDQSTTVRAPEGHPFVSGKHMVWIDSDEQGRQQVFYRSLDGSAPKQLTSASSLKMVPVVSEGQGGHVYVAWIDRRTSGTDNGGWSIWGMDLAEGVERQLSSVSGGYSHLSIDGSDIVWFNPSKYDLYRYDFLQAKETKIGTGRFPAVAKGKVLFINVQDGGLSLYNLATGQTTGVLSLPSGQFVMNIAFNGTQALFKQSDSQLRTKVVLADLNDPTHPRFTDLTTPSKKQSEYYQLYIGDGQAAWIQDNQDGNPELMGVNTQLGETHPIDTGDAAMRALAFDGYRLVLTAADGTMVYRTFTRTDTSVAVPSSGSDSGGGYSPVPAAVTSPAKSAPASKLIGRSGGEITAQEDRVKLTIAEGALSGDTTVELSPEDSGAYLPDSRGKLSLVSGVWAVRGLDQIVGEKLRLSMGYENAVLTALQERKLSLYRWDEQGKTWTRLVGKTNPLPRSVEANIPGGGIYAVGLNDVTFGDMAGHWSREVVEPLAARGIVDGVRDNEFAPDGPLTRAQFVKLLLAALGEKPVAAQGGAFTDVPSSHWGAGWIERAAKLGLVQGSNGRFDPDAVLTREQMMAMLTRAVGQEARALSLSDAELTAALTYADAGEISPWARAYAALATREGLIEGSETGIMPKQSSTRAQAAAVIYRLLDKQNKL